MGGFGTVSNIFDDVIVTDINFQLIKMFFYVKKVYETASTLFDHRPKRQKCACPQHSRLRGGRVSAFDDGLAYGCKAPGFFERINRSIEAVFCRNP